jgi:hypothetical protein
MAQSDRQGTGRHPHKDTQEPFPHTKDNEPDGEHRSRSSQTSSHSGGSERSMHGSRHDESSRSEHRGSEDADLKQREYRDEKGEVHHHTRTYMEQHRGETNKK